MDLSKNCSLGTVAVGQHSSAQANDAIEEIEECHLSHTSLPSLLSLSRCGVPWGPKVTKVTIWWPSDPARSPCTKPSPWPSPRASRWMRQSLAELRGISINVYSLLLKMVIDSWFTYLKWWFSIDIVCLPKGRCPLALLSRSISFFDMWKMRI